MAKYWVINNHEDGQCAEMMTLFDHVPVHLEGTEVRCTRPSGDHAYYLIVEGADPESLLAELPSEFDIGETRALKLGVVAL